jgi:hypothetical protein
VRGFLAGLSLTGWLLVGLLALVYVLVTYGAVVFTDPGPGLDSTAKPGRHRRRGYRPPLPRTVPPPAPQWLGGDESQGWWIWKDEQGKA